MSETEGRKSARGGRPVSGEPVIDRALRLLAVFREPGETLTLSQLATRAGLPKATAHRLLERLTAWGALERTESGSFVVGLRLLEVASLAPRGHVLRSAALPYMEDLLRATGQHVLLAVRDGSAAVLVERLSTHKAEEVQYRIGGRLPLDATGVGVTLLAESPHSFQTEILDRLAQERGATEASDLRRLLARIRREGVAVLHSHEPEHRTSVASGIRDSRGQVIAAVSVVIPSDSRRANAMIPAVMTVARAISRQMGSRV